jgi:hypothetical protein
MPFIIIYRYIAKSITAFQWEWEMPMGRASEAHQKKHIGLQKKLPSGSAGSKSKKGLLYEKRNSAVV